MKTFLPTTFSVEKALNETGYPGRLVRQAIPLAARSAEVSGPLRCHQVYKLTFPHMFGFRCGVGRGILSET